MLVRQAYYKICCTVQGIGFFFPFQFARKMLIGGGQSVEEKKKTTKNLCLYQKAQQVRQFVFTRSTVVVGPLVPELSARQRWSFHPNNACHLIRR